MDETLAAALARCASLGVPGPLPGHPEAGPGEATAALIARVDAAMYGRKRSRKAA